MAQIRRKSNRPAPQATFRASLPTILRSGYGKNTGPLSLKGFPAAPASLTWQARKGFALSSHEADSSRQGRSRPQRPRSGPLNQSRTRDQLHLRLYAVLRLRRTYPAMLPMPSARPAIVTGSGIGVLPKSFNVSA